MAGINDEPTRRYTIPLWETNHSTERLKLEEASEWMSYKLGYEMTVTTVDPSKKAYKYFSDEQYPDGNATQMDYLEGANVALMMDFNRNPQTAALGIRMPDKTYLVFDEIVSDNALSSEQGRNVAERIKTWGIKHVYLYGDNTSNQRAGKYGRTGKNDWQYIKESLQKEGITFTSKLRKQNPKRKVRVDKVNSLVYNPYTSERKILVHERCKWVLQDYMQAGTDDDGIKVDMGKIGHMSDAVDYWIYESESGGGVKFIL